MLILKNYDKHALKNEIKQARSEKLIRTYKHLNSVERDRVWEINEHVKFIYQASRIPARFDNIIFDYSVYQRLMKKLKRFDSVQYVIEEDQLHVLYRKGDTSGRFQFYDMSKYFGHFMNLPEVARVDDADI